MQIADSDVLHRRDAINLHNMSGMYRHSHIR